MDIRIKKGEKIKGNKLKVSYNRCDNQFCQRRREKEKGKTFDLDKL